MSGFNDRIAPFRVDLLIVEPTPIVTEAHFEVEAEFGERPIDSVQSAVALFQRAVVAAMFSAGRDATLEIDAVEAIAGTLSQRWRIGGLDIGAYRVLLNLLDVVDLNGTPLRGLRLRSVARSTDALDRRGLMAYPYPRSRAHCLLSCGSSSVWPAPRTR